MLYTYECMNNPLENIISPWLFPCTCEHQRCHYNARFKLNIIYIKTLPYHANPQAAPENNFKIQFIEFTYCNDKFSPKTITTKTEKYQYLIDNITNRRWNVELLIGIIRDAKTTAYIFLMKIIKEKSKIFEKTIRHSKCYK